MKQEGELAKQASESPAPKLDLSFKEGQTIKINISVSLRPRPFGLGDAKASPVLLLCHRTSGRKKRAGPDLGP